MTDTKEKKFPFKHLMITKRQHIYKIKLIKDLLLSIINSLFIYVNGHFRMNWTIKSILCKIKEKFDLNR